MHRTDWALVLKTSKYADHSLIVQVFGRECGNSPLFFKGNRTKTIDGRHLLQPMVPLRIQVEERSGHSMPKLQQVSLDVPLLSLTTDPVKISMSFFLAELLSKTLPQEFTSSELFDFLRAATELLDREERCANFHLWFIANLCKWYGLECDEWPKEVHSPNEKVSVTVLTLFNLPYRELREMSFTSELRHQLLDMLLRYMRFRLNEPIALKSLEILQQLFR